MQGIFVNRSVNVEFLGQLLDICRPCGSGQNQASMCRVTCHSVTDDTESQQPSSMTASTKDTRLHFQPRLLVDNWR